MTYDQHEGTKVTIPSYLAQAELVLPRLPVREIEQIAEILFCAYQSGRTIFTFGNGASAALASHLACDLSKGTAQEGAPRMKVLSLNDNIPLMTAWANDTAYENVYAEQLKNFVQPDDVAFAISCSGNSRNVLQALRTARASGAITVGLTGFQGGHLKDLCDCCAIVPSNSMQIIEDMHAIIAHAVSSVMCAHISAMSRVTVSAH
jgi:D-sedoheptulose 7-phosphate isomerase